MDSLQEELDLECRRCGGHLTASRAPRGAVVYYHCSSCRMTVTSADPVALRRVARAAVATTEATEEVADPSLNEWRRRLDAFLTRADETDPFAKLSLPPTATFAEARDRFHALALAHHPDRGGDAQLLGSIIEAYDRIRDRFSMGRTPIGDDRPLAPAVVQASGKPVLARRRPASWSRWSTNRGPATLPQPDASLAKRG